MGISKKKCSIEKDIVLKRKPGRPPKTLIRIITKSTMEYIKKVESLNLDGNIAENWRKFKQSFETISQLLLNLVRNQRRYELECS